MHEQIKNAIKSIRLQTDGNVSVCLSAGQCTPLGSIVGKMYYNTNLTSLIRSVGYPHNGGEHTFTYIGSIGDYVAFTQLLQEEMKKLTLTDEQKLVVSQLSFICQELLLLKKHKSLTQ